MTTGLEKLLDAEGEGKQDRPRLVSVKRTTGTERPKASLFEREARVCDANSEVQGASSEVSRQKNVKKNRYLCTKTRKDAINEK